MITKVARVNLKAKYVSIADIKTRYSRVVAECVSGYDY